MSKQLTNDEIMKFNREQEEKRKKSAEKPVSKQNNKPSKAD